MINNYRKRSQNFIRCIDFSILAEDKSGFLLKKDIDSGT